MNSSLQCAPDEIKLLFAVVQHDRIAHRAATVFIQPTDHASFACLQMAIASAMRRGRAIGVNG